MSFSFDGTSSESVLVDPLAEILGFEAFVIKRSASLACDPHLPSAHPPRPSGGFGTCVEPIEVGRAPGPRLAHDGERRCRSYCVRRNSLCSFAVESPPTHTSNCSGSTTHFFEAGLQN